MSVAASLTMNGRNVREKCATDAIFALQRILDSEYAAHGARVTIAVETRARFFVPPLRSTLVVAAFV
jgi:hypothetical protein